MSEMTFDEMPLPKKMFIICATPGLCVFLLIVFVRLADLICPGLFSPRPERKRAMKIRETKVLWYYEQIPPYRPKKGEHVLCSMCLSECCTEPKDTVQIECGHKFHARCIEKWFKTNDTCFVCGKDMPKAYFVR